MVVPRVVVITTGGSTAGGAAEVAGGGGGIVTGASTPTGVGWSGGWSSEGGLDDGTERGTLREGATVKGMVVMMTRPGLRVSVGPRFGDRCGLG